MAHKRAYVETQFILTMGNISPVCLVHIHILIYIQEKSGTVISNVRTAQKLYAT